VVAGKRHLWKLGVEAAYARDYPSRSGTSRAVNMGFLLCPTKAAECLPSLPAVAEGASSGED